MRLFHIKITPVPDYEWTQSDEKYVTMYAKEREDARVKAAHQAEALNRIGLVVVKGEPLIVNERHMIDLTVSKVAFEMVAEIAVDDPENPVDLPGAMRKFSRLAQKLISMPGLNEPPKPMGFNEVCQVHMPGQAMATFNDVMLLTDSCSDVLQESLAKGWRIIAACPQPDQRRPDYVLGRYNPERQVDEFQARRAP